MIALRIRRLSNRTSGLKAQLAAYESSADPLSDSRTVSLPPVAGAYRFQAGKLYRDGQALEAHRG